MRTPKIAVVIPFFQRDSGILSRTLISVAAQEYPKDSLYVILVDDGSPMTAEAEFSLNPPPPNLRIVTIRQENGGPGAARDTGLNNLEPGTDIVAFIDSDDEWIGDHLKRVARCLSLGYTAYFANLYHLGNTVDEFTKAHRITVEQHAVVDGDPTLREYSGDMIHQIATANVVFMPTLAIAVPELGTVRFPSGFKHGGEDYLYWMELTVRGARFVFSTKPEVRCGPGINMWSRSGWGTDGLAKRILDETRYRQYAIQKYARSNTTKIDLRNRIAELQINMLMDVAYRLRRSKPIDWKVVRDLLIEIPPSLTTVSLMIKSVMRRLQ